MFSLILKKIDIENYLHKLENLTLKSNEYSC